MDRAADARLGGEAGKASAGQGPTSTRAAELSRLVLWTLVAAEAGPCEDAEQAEVDMLQDPVNVEPKRREELENLAEYLAASFDELANAQAEAGGELPGDPQAWSATASEWLEASDGDAADRVRSNALALGTLAEGLYVMFGAAPPSEAKTAPSSAKFAVGEHVLAVMAQDGQWHAAKVEGVDEPQGTSRRGKATYSLRFKQFGNPQTTKEEDIVPDLEYRASLANGAELSWDGSSCQVCGRAKRMTFHHLIPKETHSSLLRRVKEGRRTTTVLEEGIEAMFQAEQEIAVARGDKPRTRREWLGSHGIMVCGPCHSQIHRIAPNAELARRFNTLALVLADPRICRWRGWASKQK